ncbi:MAG TPA: peptidylprolyl isomerase [Vitreimonas sp.]|jgi:peptidylprolyl isomerase|nr:peptidylprolyl isomerase [Vitreimonas sp.]
MRFSGFLGLMALAACATAAPADSQTPVRSLGEILERSPASDWAALDPDWTLYMELAQGRVIIQLSPDFSPQHAENVRALARAHYWDGAFITRVQDNYVVQWGRAEDSPADFGQAQREIAAPEYYRDAAGLPFTRLQDPDSYAPQNGFTNGFWAARNGRGETWMIHCYGAIGVGRENPPNTGNSSELYTVIGQAPRHLDRNLAMVGRIVQGMELLTSLPRGTGPLGFYENPEQRVPIRSVRLASEVPAAERTNLETLRTDSQTFRDVIASRRHRREEFFAEPTGRINVCNVPLPVRAAR